MFVVTQSIHIDEPSGLAALTHAPYRKLTLSRIGKSYQHLLIFLYVSYKFLRQFNTPSTSSFHFLSIKFQHPNISNYTNSHVILHITYVVVRPLFLMKFPRPTEVPQFLTRLNFKVLIFHLVKIHITTVAHRPIQTE
jgi:hypothetical protein